MGHAGQVEGVGVGQSHAFVVVPSVLWLDDVPISVDTMFMCINRKRIYKA